MDEITRLNQTWEREHAPNIDGFVASYLIQPDRKTDECILIALFEDRETYEANAGSPEQDRWYRQMRELLEDDPAWEDGEVIYSTTGAKPEPTV
jgi:heme-degrading monooxygenase HmoA